MMKLVMDYSAPPDEDWFVERIGLARLMELQAEVAASTESSEWGRHTNAIAADGIACAIRAVQAGQTVFMARDEDGLYFAIGGCDG